MLKNKYMKIILIIFLSSLPSFKSELFTALIDLAKVIETKNDLSNVLIKYVTEEEKRLNELKEFLSEFKFYNITDEILRDSNDIEKYFSNPINTFLFTKKFAHDWKEKMDLLRNFADSRELQLEIEKYRVSLPASDDVNGVTDALIRMQETYHLKSSDLSSGIIQSVQSYSSFTADDCFNIGHHAYMNKKYEIATKWFKEALHLYHVNKSSNGSELQEVTILDYLSYCLGSTGLYQAALKFNDKILEDPFVKDRDRFLDNKLWYMERIALQRFPNDNEDPPFPNHYDGNNYAALCRNESPINFKQNIANLKCYNRVNHPFFTVRPLKTEVVFDKPRLVLFHDILYDDEIEHIKQVASPRLNRATIINPSTGQLEYANYRISKSAWLSNDFDTVTKRINERIIAVTGLSIDMAEDLQVVNYGIGGHYSPHFDHGNKDPVDSFEIERGNRIATLLFYMSNVDAGGATVFTSIGAKLWPRKGSAAFWYNLKMSGDSDDLTVHAGCPVLVGSKWVMNKWFHERGQEFARPCGLRDSD